MTFPLKVTMYANKVETIYSDQVYPGQIDHCKWMIITTNFFSFFFFISPAYYHLIDICIFIAWIKEGIMWLNTINPTWWERF